MNEKFLINFDFVYIRNLGLSVCYNVLVFLCVYCIYFGRFFMCLICVVFLYATKSCALHFIIKYYE
jgi:hypothetical protein